MRRSTMMTLKPTIKLNVSHFENESELNKPRIDSYGRGKDMPRTKHRSHKINE